MKPIEGADLYLSGGVSTGNASSHIYLQTYPAGGTGTADTTPSTVLDLFNNKVGFFGATPVVKQAALTTALTTASSSAPVTPDYSIGGGTNSSAWGFSTQDELLSIMKVIANLQARVNELETKLKNYGLLN